MTTPTPFPFDLTPAFQTFFQTVDAAQYHGMNQDDMEEMVEKALVRLDHQWETLEALARIGLEDAIKTALDVLLREWAQKEALALLLRSSGVFVDPTDTGLQAAFWQKLQRQHLMLSSELLVSLETGKQQRVAAQAQQQPTQWETLALDLMQRQHQHQLDWQAAAFQLLREQPPIRWETMAMDQAQWQHQHHLDWQGAAFQLLREQHASWANTHQVAQSWATLAQDSVHQAQQGVQQMYSFAADVHTNTTSMLTSTQEQQQQVVEEAVQRAHGRQIMNRLILVGAILLFLFGAFGCAFFAASHLLR